MRPGGDADLILLATLCMIGNALALLAVLVSLLWK
jgi:hypothetical protein